jgi:hypothetical protein
MGFSIGVAHKTDARDNNRHFMDINDECQVCL